jgi:hypothetical protein
MCQECRCDLKEAHHIEGKTVCFECFIEFCKHYVLESIRDEALDSETVDLASMDPAWLAAQRGVLVMPSSGSVN